VETPDDSYCCPYYAIVTVVFALIELKNSHFVCSNKRKDKRFTQNFGFGREPLTRQLEKGDILLEQRHQ
jgi:hypothetical protein